MLRRGRGLFYLVLAALWAVPTASAQVPDLVSHFELRVCADPSDLPFSNRRHQGFENKIADVIGKDLGLPVRYVWFPQIGGFIRNTLHMDRCDLVMGVTAGDDRMSYTNPYYYSAYMLVTRKDSGIAADALTDPSLKGKKIGLIAATPPSDLMVEYKMMNQVVSYPLVVDTRHDAPARQMLLDVADHKIDVALIWGPFAGYYIKHDHLPLNAVFLKGDGKVRLDFHIAMGVRANDDDWRRRIDKAIADHHAEIVHILDDYGIPRLDEQGHVISAGQGAP